MKKTLAALAAAAMLAGCSGTQTETENKEDKVYTVGVAQLVEQTSLNTIREAMYDEFEQLGYTEGENIILDYQNAAGKPANLDAIMAKYEAENADLIVAIATATAQSAQNYTDTIPLVFSAVADPVGAGLAESMDSPNKNITGTSFVVQVDQILDLIQEINPDTQTIGAIYTPSETNGVYTLNKFKEEAESRGLTVIDATGTDLTTLQQAADSLVGKVDVFFSPNDNIVASGMTALAETAKTAGIPYYTAADSMVMDGGFATVGIDYEELGRETARMAVRVLEGEQADSIPIKVFDDDLSTYINQTTLEALDIQLPETTASRKKLVTFS